MKSCKCENLTLSNSGTPDCQSLMSYAEMPILVPKYGSDGEINRIDLSDTLNQAYFTAKVNAADPRDRWYPFPRVKDAVSTKGESVFKTYTDNSKKKIRDGVRSWTMLFPEETPQLLKQMEAWGCNEFGLLIADKAKNLIGMENEAGFLDPILVDKDSWNPVLQFATGDDVQTIVLGFDIDLTQEDSNLNMILASEISPVNLLNLAGLLDVVSTVSAITTTGFTVKLSTLFGTALNKITVKGLVEVDFVSSVTAATAKVRNQTDSADVTITSTENPDGTYAIAFTAQTSGDVLILKPKFNGYDFAAVEAAVITIP